MYDMHDFTKISAAFRTVHHQETKKRQHFEKRLLQELFEKIARGNAS